MNKSLEESLHVVNQLNVKLGLLSSSQRKENDDLFQQLTSNKVLQRVSGLDLRALFVGSASQSGRPDLTD
ncbi:hypothetical protein KUCAC02_013884 [Chaenocephalus aceratus]|uniref:Uncharacterized protein n=1 Tax=Chaenocephalus aceratus TaxID=36190 RepID=A0ACB9WD42_CHAAC|nr:hypothetical protein KUCAC02_013884 [Chaenocephalus aceratus]